MAECCDPTPYRSLFDEKEARRRLRNYRKRGLDPLATGIVDFLKGQGVTGMTLLEVGGGIGDLQVEMLQAGVDSAVSVELSPEWETVSRELFAAAGLDQRVERLFGDFVAEQESIDHADIVVLNRVICCYPWMDRLMGAALFKSDRYLALVVPRSRWLSRLFVGVSNGVNRLRGCDFEAFVHDVSQLEQLALDEGMAPVYRNQNLFWQALVFQR